MFALGGKMNQLRTEYVEMLDLSLQTPQWLMDTEMVDGRVTSGVGALNNCILYAVSFTNMLLILYCKKYNYIFNIILNFRLMADICIRIILLIINLIL